MTDARYIAMWSGPRNISTAMMRSWGNRADTIVHDEPFYAYYLANRDFDHPGRDEIIATYPSDWREVTDQLTAPLPAGKSIYYQKHMTQHILPDIDKSWMKQVTNCFLIRDPRRMIVSFSKVVPNPTMEQMGLSQQIELFDYVCDVTGNVPPVISAKDVLTDPRLALSTLCEAINVPFDEAMLSWRAGKRDTDGIWSKYWYASVENSTGFMAYEEDNTPVPDHLTALFEECETLYEHMAQYRLLA